TEDNDDDLYG
nr:Chain E, Transitional Endoplasmic Reticulum Atpase (ter Atp [Homo sapiens]3EBB_F Chain F, Transitional Endoplasmic Reticulum Atpase (ter Atp [Homo sapiens]3EBB_G Chain G, Transitional Endoplasmic Reticulum Atpase (ter Atp [Homo sapiens]3EBB_H Chain H, Transitional Endoplasmic Reticulum Atpase (ter Atp [Homo sapiens]4P0A_B Chain B, Transitional endoplasmic reticulum ATPase [Homo sapiens]4P0A_D Chain D, Transitional endoplasmic reticulum ATPase [Homo sapiens]